MIRLAARALLPAFAAALVLGCQAEAPAPAPPPPPVPAPAPAPAPAVAVATIAGAEGSSLAGTVTFTETAGGVQVVAHLSGLPAGPHGLHLHAGTECVGDFTSAGGHFNPSGVDHGAPDAAAHHAGDFGNVEGQADGSGHAELTSSAITVSPGETSVVGHAVIVHADPDDLVTQPTGNAGARLGCGVVALAGGEPAAAAAAPADAAATDSGGEPSGGDTEGH